MSDEETLQKHHEESDSEEEEEDQLEDVPDINIDVTKLTPLSPEVISKQVSKGALVRSFSVTHRRRSLKATINLGARPVTRCDTATELSMQERSDMSPTENRQS
jgi:hypothetical protein